MSTAAEAVIAAIVIFAALRLLVARDVYAQMLYLNVVGFGISGLIGLTWRTDMGLVAALCTFVFSTLESNAIAYTLDKVRKIRRESGT